MKPYQIHTSALEARSMEAKTTERSLVGTTVNPIQNFIATEKTILHNLFLDHPEWIIGRER